MILNNAGFVDEELRGLVLGNDSVALCITAERVFVGSL